MSDSTKPSPEAAPSRRSIMRKARQLVTDWPRLRAEMERVHVRAPSHLPRLLQGAPARVIIAHSNVAISQPGQNAAKPDL